MEMSPFVHYGMILGAAIGAVLVPALINRFNDVKKLTAGWKLLATAGAAIGGFMLGLVCGEVFGLCLFAFVDGLYRL